MVQPTYEPLTRSTTIPIVVLIQVSLLHPMQVNTSICQPLVSMILIGWSLLAAVATIGRQVLIRGAVSMHTL